MPQSQWAVSRDGTCRPAPKPQSPSDVAVEGAMELVDATANTVTLVMDTSDEHIPLPMKMAVSIGQAAAAAMTLAIIAVAEAIKEQTASSKELAERVLCS